MTTQKTNEEIVKELLMPLTKKLGIEDFGWLTVNLSKALEAKDQKHKEEILPKPYAIGKVQNDGQDFTDDDKDSVYLLFKDEEAVKAIQTF